MIGQEKWKGRGVIGQYSDFYWQYCQTLIAKQELRECGGSCGSNQGMDANVNATNTVRYDYWLKGSARETGRKNRPHGK